MNERKSIVYLKKKRLHFKVSKHKKAIAHVNWNRNEIIYLYSICILQKKNLLIQNDLNHLYSIFLNRKTKKQIASKITTSKEDIEQLTDKIPSKLIEHNMPFEEVIKSISLFLFDFFKDNDYNRKSSDMLFEPHSNEKRGVIIEMNDSFFDKLKESTKGVINYYTLNQYLAGEKTELTLNLEQPFLSTFNDSMSNSFPELTI